MEKWLEQRGAVGIWSHKEDVELWKVGDVRKKHWLVASHTPPVGDLAWNPGMCPYWESNRWPFVLPDDAQPTEPYLWGRFFLFFKFIDFRETEERRDIETLIYCSTYLCIHWLLLVYALAGDQTCNLAGLGQCSKKLSYPARADGVFLRHNSL